MNDVNVMVQESLKMKMFDHPNILQLIGVSIDAGEAPYLVMPYMANGSLLSYLRKERANLTIAQEAEEELVSATLLARCVDWNGCGRLGYYHRHIFLSWLESSSHP